MPASRKLAQMFHDPHQYSYLSLLEENYEAIKSEALALPDEQLVPYPVEEFYNQGWWVCGLYSVDYPGLPATELEPWLARNRELCPVATSVAQRLPGNHLAGFSILEPGCQMEPHVHEEGYFLCHLGLVIPEGCGLQVGDERRVWKEGECLVFHETTPHFAWNLGSSRRIIFLVDFLPE